MDEKDKPKNKEVIQLSNGKKLTRKTWIMATLRRASYRWPARNESEKIARVERGLYKCAMCEGTFRNGEYAIDHIKSVISLKDGFTTWDDVIENLFCDVEGFQILCHPCHDIKTAQEDSMRANYNAEKKELAKQHKKEEKLRQKEINRLTKKVIDKTKKVK